MTEQEHRQFSRVQFDATSELIVGGKRLPTNLLDISLKGSLLVRPEGFKPILNDLAELQVQLNGTDIMIQMQGQIAHIEETHLGFKCVTIDLDSIAHLRRLLELNTGDPSLVERELSALL